MTCDHCRRAARRNHPDIHFIEPEGAHGYLVDQIREVVADAHLAPIQATRKIYIIDRVDLLGTQAANAFLKTLEEPPENVVFILLGRTKDAVLPTIVSRCQVVPFRHIPTTEASGIISQNTGVSAEPGAHRGRGVQWLGHESDRILQEPRKDRLSPSYPRDSHATAAFRRARCARIRC